MTEDQLVADVFVKEGDTYGDKDTKPPIDQPTARGGITLPVLRAYIAATRAPLNPTVPTLKGMTRMQAQDIVRWQLRTIAAAHAFDKIGFEPLKLQLIDFAYNSGAPLAIRWLQRVLRVPRTSTMDQTTFVALFASDAWLIHQALIAARVQMVILSTTPGGAIDHRFKDGIEARASSFSLLEVP